VAQREKAAAMSFTTIKAHDLLRQLHSFDSIIDARSEAEYALDHLPQALNWPTLNNAQRHEIGTLYKQVNAFEAKKRGAAMAAHNIAQHLERHVLSQPREWRPLAYCWRGGKRSGSLALILDQIGFRVTLLEGGYKAFRAATVEAMPSLVGHLRWQVVCGPTGCGKTRLLQALQSQGAQVLDLEALANHRSSVLGAIMGLPQPSQKHFDTLLWDSLRQFDPTRPVYVECESKKVGNVAIPTPLIDAIRTSPCLHIDLPIDSRIALLLEDYDHLVQNTDYFCARLDILAQFKGKQLVQAWKEQVQQGQLKPVVQDLLAQHYDPIYQQSMARNFSQITHAQTLTPKDHSVPAMQELARHLLTPSR
jgi:tRNA 2-selenouridine synthase